jgi:hypothetical protein
MQRRVARRLTIGRSASGRARLLVEIDAVAVVTR